MPRRSVARRPRACSWTCAIALVLTVGHAVGAPQQADSRGPRAEGSPDNADPLGRDTPRGTITGFSTAMSRDDLATAARFLQISAAQRRHVDTLARNLGALLDRYFTQSVSKLSNHPGGIPDDGLPLDHERVTLRLEDDKTIDLRLVRVGEGPSGPVWLISSNTLQTIASLSTSVSETWIHRYLPATLAERSLFAASLAQWAVWAASIVIPVLALWLLSGMLIALVRRSVDGPARRAVVEHWYAGLRLPLVLAIALGGHLASVPLFVLTLQTRLVYARYGAYVAVVVVSWLFWRLLTLSFTDARSIAQRRGHASTRSLMLLGERVAKALVFLAAAFVFLRIAGVDTTTALAGVGLGGVAVALGAQKSIENFLGGVFLLTDKALAVGDVCCIANRMGSVEDITLRSVRIRTLEQTLLSIPAGVLAQATVENLSTRAKILIQTILRLRYGTTPEQLRTILEAMHDTLIGHPDVETDTARVRLTGFGETSIEIELFAYVKTSDVLRFLAVREDVLLHAASIVESSGAAFAAPAQLIGAGGQLSV